MKNKLQIILLMSFFLGCVNKEATPQQVYNKNAIELINAILLCEKNDCHCILKLPLTNTSLLENLQTENPSFNKEILKKELFIKSDSTFKICNDLSKSYRFPSNLKNSFIFLNVDEIRLVRKDSLVAKKLFKKCPNFWINIGPPIFNEDYSKAIIPVNNGIGGSLLVYNKIDNKWKVFKTIMAWIE